MKHLIPLLAFLIPGLAAAQAPIGKADTLFLAGKWKDAISIYEAQASAHPERFKALTWNRLGYCYHNTGNYKEAIKNYHKALAAGPSPQLKPYLASRLARSYSAIKDNVQALHWLDSAVASGYSNLGELDTLRDYDAIRKDKQFEVLHARVYAAAYPCMQNPKSREFDFWIGEWDVYQTGTSSPKVGHSLIQSASGGCMILENWTSLQGAYSGKSINYVDPAAKSWEQDWIGSDGTPIRFYNGSYKDGIMQFTFDAIQPDGNKHPGRLSFYNQGKDQVRQLSEHSADEGKTWLTNYDFTYIRRGK